MYALDTLPQKILIYPYYEYDGIHLIQLIVKSKLTTRIFR